MNSIKKKDLRRQEETRRHHIFCSQEPLSHHSLFHTHSLKKKFTGLNQNYTIGIFSKVLPDRLRSRSLLVSPLIFHHDVVHRFQEA